MPQNTCRDTGQTVFFDRVNEFYGNFALSPSTRVLRDLDLTLGIRNIFDFPPPRLSNGGTSYQAFRGGTASTLSLYELLRQRQQGVLTS